MAAIDDLIQQILGQKTTDKWTGEGYGGAEANAKAMAKLLADAGITDIRQFGKVDKYEPVEVTGYSLNGNTVQNPSKGVFYEEIPQYDGEGGIQGFQRRNLSPEEIAQVQPQYGIVEYDSDGGRSVRQVTNVTEKDGQLLGVTGQTYGNKVTGQAIESGTGRWQKQGGEGLFSGTGEGKGNTGFRVDFAPDGTPVFYTTQGTSNDLALAIEGLGPIGSVAANYLAMQFGGPAGVAALNAAQGKSAGDIAKAALLAYAGGELQSSLGGGGATDASSLTTDSGGLLGTPTEVANPLTNDLYSITSPVAKSLDGLKAGTAANLDSMGIGQGFQFNVGAPVTSVADAVKAIATMNGSFNPANLASMGGGQGLTYQTPTGLVTEGGTLNVGGMTGNNSVISQGGIDTASNIGSDIAKRVAAIETGVDNIKMPATPTEPATAAKGLGVSDALRAAGLVATLAGAGSALGSGGSGGYPIVPIPSDWTSPIKPTGVAEFTPLTAIDFGNKEMLQGTQWEKLLDPNYGKALAMPTTPINPSNMSFDQLMSVLGNTRTSIPTQSVSINDVIAGIQSQYGQTPTGSMG
jgi:hypothetical protein